MYTPKIEARFHGKVGPSDDPEVCWEWLAGTSKGGYGLFWDGAAMVYAHRVAYELSVGGSPRGWLRKQIALTIEEEAK